MDEPPKNTLSHRERVRARGSKDLTMRARALRRQMVIGSYIVDFVCLEAKLIIEVDGGQHAEQAVYDARRTARLEAMGYRVMCFWNNEILSELTNVLEQIRMALIEAPHPRQLLQALPYLTHPWGRNLLPEGEETERFKSTHRFFGRAVS